MRAHVIGNVALDETIQVDDLPTPGASILGVELSRDLGGKGANQAVVLGRAGLSCRFSAPIGRDTRGAEIRAALAGEPVEARLVELDGVRSDISIILMSAGGENTIVTTNEAASALPPELAIGGLSDAAPGDLLVLQGNLSFETTRSLLDEGRARGLRVAVNPSPVRDFFADLWPMVDMAFVNEGEAKAFGGVDRLIALGVRHVALTLGARGAQLIQGEGTAVVAAAPAKVIDPTGAGDCFMATALASAALRGVDLDVRALSHAARAAALVVERPGTMRAFPTPAEMSAILAS
jgi:ribokinase